MKRFPLFCVVALLGAAVSVPAQVSIEGRIGRHVRGTVVIGHRDHRDHRDTHERRPHREPVLRVPAPPRGHWKTVYDEVLVPGYWHEEHVPPTYGWIQDRCGHRRWGMVDKGGCRRVWVPARYETRARQVWVGC
jgi:hypothetical protein